MSTLSEQILIEAPAGEAQARLAAYDRALGRRDGTVRLTLSLPVVFDGVLIPLGVQRTVVATLAPYRVPGEIAPRRAVRWAPLRPGPFPTFSGELSVERAEGGAAFTLVLDGRYDPPGGAVGEEFNALVGRTVARATARDLLERIKTSLEGRGGF